MPAISQLAVFTPHSGASPRVRTPCPVGRSLGRPSLRAGRVARFSKQNHRVPSKICNSGNNTLPFSVKCVPCHIWTHSPCLGWGSQTSGILPCGSRRARGVGVRSLSMWRRALHWLLPSRRAPDSFQKATDGARERQQAPGGVWTPPPCPLSSPSSAAYTV